MADNAGDDPDVATLPRELSNVDFRRIRMVREGALVLMSVLVLVGVTGLLGVRDATVSSFANGYGLRVMHPWITRGGLDADWSLRVRRHGGFSRPVTVAVSRDYLDFFQVAHVFPEPMSQLSAPPYLYLTFARPPGDTLDVTFPASTKPTVTGAGRHDAEVLIPGDGRPLARLRYHTWVVP